NIRKSKSLDFALITHLLYPIMSAYPPNTRLLKDYEKAPAFRRGLTLCLLFDFLLGGLCLYLHRLLYSLFRHSLLRHVFQHRMGCRKPCDRHTERRAGDIVIADDMAPLDGFGVAAMLTADTDFEILTGFASFIDRQLHQPAHAVTVERLEGILFQNALL